MTMLFKTLVRAEHLNHNQCLFGGYMLLWVDEYAFIAATEEFPSARFVTRAMEAAAFEESVSDGSILTFQLERVLTDGTAPALSPGKPSPRKRRCRCRHGGHGGFLTRRARKRPASRAHGRHGESGPCQHGPDWDFL